MKTETQDQLAWEAFQYISGDLTGGERETFESRLAADQSAREAVAAAVEMTQAVNLALEAELVTIPQPAMQARGNAWAPHSWILSAAMGAAACLLIMLGVQQLQQSKNKADRSSPSVESATPEPIHDTALAARWSQIRQQDSELWGEEVDSDFTDGLADWELAEEAEDSAPDWMMAAVSAARQVQGMNDDMDMERSVDGPVEQ